jgi:hypothetical protein
MAFRDYVAPGVTVIVERQQIAEVTPETQYLPVFIGTGFTSSSRTDSYTGLTTSNVTAPTTTSRLFDFDYSSKISSALYEDTSVSLKIYATQSTKRYNVTHLSNSNVENINNEGKITWTDNFNKVVSEPTFPSITISSIGTGTVYNTASAHGLIVGDVLKYNSELVLVATAPTDTTFTLTRAQFATTIDTTLLANSVLKKIPYFQTTQSFESGTSSITAATVPSWVKAGQKLQVTTNSGSPIVVEEMVVVDVASTTQINVVRAASGNVATGSALHYVFLKSESDYFTITLNSSTTFDVSITLNNADDDFEPRLVVKNDKFNAEGIFGPHFLTENGNTVRNDIAIAAEVAFRSNVDVFYYLEVPRTYGSSASVTNLITAMEKIYYKRNIYRIVPLASCTSTNNLAAEVRDFVEEISNQLDQRETTAFIHVEDTTTTDNINNYLAGTGSPGAVSETLDSKRVCNVFGARNVHMVLGNTTHELPGFYLAVAVAALDSSLDVYAPLTNRNISIGSTSASVFSKVNAPRFRPQKWNQLAEKGVFIVYQSDVNEPLTIRHQLTTSQSGDAENQEYSIVKNVDAVTKLLRDLLSVYTGREVISQSLLEKLDGSLTIAIEEAKTRGYCREITVLSPWTVKTYPGTTVSEERRNLIVYLSFTPSYPANNLDIHLIL